MKEDIARAAATDAANRRMRSEGRTQWNREDYNHAVREYNRLVGRSFPNGSKD